MDARATGAIILMVSFIAGAVRKKRATFFSNVCCNVNYFFFESVSHQKQILAKLVDLPTPLTPQKVTTYGFPAFLAEMTSRRMSIRRFGVSSDSSESVSVSLMVRWMLCRLRKN
jgi:hypothetical protein